MDQNRTDSARVPALDLLRLAAVGAVIIYHYGFWGPAISVQSVRVMFFIYAGLLPTSAAQLEFGSA